MAGRRRGKTIAVHNPATGQQIGRVAHAGIADLDQTLAAAQKGFEVWRDMPAIERAKAMRRAATLVRERADAIAAIMTQSRASPGRGAWRPWPRPTSSVVLPTRACASMAASCRRATWRAPAGGEGPVGVVAAFTPWNFPSTRVVRKLARRWPQAAGAGQGARGDAGQPGRADPLRLPTPACPLAWWACMATRPRFPTT